MLVNQKKKQNKNLSIGTRYRKEITTYTKTDVLTQTIEHVMSSQKLCFIDTFCITVSVVLWSNRCSDWRLVSERGGARPVFISAH